jgi:glycosyltransferase involved in cell wall biosynthesis/SAM-dependent methyltransferase
MNVTVSCAGRFHAFHLVEQLNRRKALGQFITTTLNSKLLPNRALPDSLEHDPDFLKRVITLPLPEYLCYGIRQIPSSASQSFAYFIKDNLYDLNAAKRIGDCDLFVGWADQSLFQLREAKSRSAKTIIERGSTHINYQYGLLNEEREKLGITHTTTASGFDAKLIEKQLKEYHEADYIMVPSEFALKSFANTGIAASKLLKVPYGIDLSRFKPVERQLNRPGTIKILFIGPIGIQKGIRYLLKAVKQLRAKGLRVELTVIGKIEEEFRRYFEQSPLRSEITNHIPFIPNSELSAQFSAHDVFCLPSLQEGLALVIGEAMASGLPVVTTENSGGTEYLRQGVDGYIVPPADTASLVTHLEELAGNPNRIGNMGRAAASRAQEFSWDRYGDEIFKTYERVLASTNASTNEDGQEIANYYDEYWNREKGWTPSHSFTNEQLILHFDDLLKPSDLVLDVGCGDAENYQAWLVQKVEKLAAIDISKSGVEHAKQLGLDAQVHDFSERFPYDSNSFDAAICVEVLEHLYDPKYCVSEITRILKPGGLLIASVPNNGYFRERLKMLTRAELSTSITDFGNEWKGAHIRFYSIKSFTRMLEVAGMNIELVRSNGDSSIFDGADAVGGYVTQQITSMLRQKLPRALKLSFLEDIWPSLFAPHMIVWARKKGV